MGGAGHKRLARFSSIIKSKKYSRLYAMYSRGGSTALEWFLGRGNPLNPYLRGLIIKELRNKLRPKDLKVAPLYCYPVEQVYDFQEYAMLRSWMKEWLQYVKWYAQTALSPDITIDKLFDSPMVMNNWKITRKDSHLVRFGIFWKVYDLVGQIGLDPLIPILDLNPSTLGGCVVGGSDETGFLVQLSGLVQPRAGGGTIGPATNTIMYKTLGVADRLVEVDYLRQTAVVRKSSISCR